MTFPIKFCSTFCQISKSVFKHVFQNQSYEQALYSNDKDKFHQTNKTILIHLKFASTKHVSDEKNKIKIWGGLKMKLSMDNL